MNNPQSPKNSRLREGDMKAKKANKSGNRNYSLTSSLNMEIINYKIQQSRLSNSYPVCKVGLWFNSLSNPEHGEVNLIEVRV